MNAPHPSAAFAVARPAVVERFLIDGQEQPTAVDRAAADVMALPILKQIAVFQRVMNTREWADMAHTDYDRIEAALGYFADLKNDEADEEDVRLHGPVEMTRYYL